MARTRPTILAAHPGCMLRPADRAPLAPASFELAHGCSCVLKPLTDALSRRNLLTAEQATALAKAVGRQATDATHMYAEELAVYIAAGFARPGASLSSSLARQIRTMFDEHELVRTGLLAGAGPDGRTFIATHGRSESLLFNALADAVLATE